MDDFKGFVLISELHKKVGVSNSCLFQLRNIKIKKMGSYACVQIESLPLKYQEVAKNDCLDLEYFRSYSSLSEDILRTKDYLNVLENQSKKKYKHIKIGHAKLFEITSEFLEYCKKVFSLLKYLPKKMKSMQI